MLSRQCNRNLQRLLPRVRRQHRNRDACMDGAHMPNLRKDLRLLVLEGVTSDNTIYTIAFMLCWGETIATVGRFFDLLKYHRPHFYDGWFDNEATTLIADRAAPTISREEGQEGQAKCASGGKSALAFARRTRSSPRSFAVLPAS